MEPPDARVVGACPPWDPTVEYEYPYTPEFFTWYGPVVQASGFVLTGDSQDGTEGGRWLYAELTDPTLVRDEDHVPEAVPLYQDAIDGYLAELAAGAAMLLQLEPAAEGSFPDFAAFLRPDGGISIHAPCGYEQFVQPVERYTTMLNQNGDPRTPAEVLTAILAVRAGPEYQSFISFFEATEPPIS